MGGNYAIKQEIIVTVMRFPVALLADEHHSITISTIRDFIEHRCEILPHCNKVKFYYSTNLDLNYIAEKSGLDFGHMIQAINPLLHCTNAAKNFF